MTEQQSIACEEDTISPCRHNPDIRCGVVKNQANCPYLSEELCENDKRNGRNLVGIVDENDVPVSMFEMRYLAKRLDSELDMCDRCRIIWVNRERSSVCPICDYGE